MAIVQVPTKLLFLTGEPLTSEPAIRPNWTLAGYQAPEEAELLLPRGL